jgi:hypothetical protein
MATNSRIALMEERKNKAIETLSEQFSQNVLPLEEYERLVEYINRTESERELAIVERIVDETALYARQGSEPERESSGFAGTPQFKMALLSSRETAGEALRGGQSAFFSVLGTNLIDIREGDLPPGRTEVDVVSILGETKITVPPGVTVTMKAFPIAGETRLGRGVETQRRPGAPELVITGCALLGAIVVKTRREKNRP